MFRSSAVALLLASSVVAPVQAESSGTVRVGRYAALAPVPTAAQLNPLAQTVSIAFPTSVRTVEGAIGQLLVRSGYRLAPADPTDVPLIALLSLPLPDVHRTLGPIPLMEALQLLAGPAFRLLVDHRHRLVSFEVIDAYRELAAGSSRP